MDFSRERKFFFDEVNASGWCKVLKPLGGFNLTVTWSGLFHKLFNRPVENSAEGLAGRSLSNNIYYRNLTVWLTRRRTCNNLNGFLRLADEKA
jgi:hypothetical protein